MKLISVPAVIMAAVSLYVGLNYLWLYFRRRKDPENLAFSAASISIGFYDIFCAGLYSASSVQEGIIWQRSQFAALAVFTAAVSWFIYIIVRLKSRIPFAVITVLSVIFLITGIFISNDMTLSVKNPFIKEIFFAGFTITYYEADPGLLYSLQYIYMVATSGFLLYILIKNYFDEENSRNRTILFSMLIFFISAVNDILVGSGIYMFVYLLEYSYMFIVLSMAAMLQNSFISLHHEVEELTQQLEEKVDERTIELFISEITRSLYAEISEKNNDQNDKKHGEDMPEESRVSSLSRDISIIMNIDKLINRTLEKAVEVSGAAGGCLYINSSSGGTELKSRTGSIEPPAGMPVIAEMAIKESWTELTEKQGENGADINIMIPVILEGKTQGLCCLYRTGGSFGKREKILAKCFIRQAAGAMENAFLYQRMINRNAVLHQHSVTVNIEEKIKKAISYISENYHSDISREGLASSINMHPDSFGRFFKIYTGKKINEFINELRVIEAAGKIRNSDDNIIDIAFSAGFESLPTFNRAFMKLMKVTPTKYREK